MAKQYDGKERRGFAAMDPAKQRAIAAKGGRASREKGFAKMEPKLRRAIAAKGGRAAHRRSRSASK